MLRTAAGSLLGPLARQLTAGQPRILFYHRFGDTRRAMSPRLFVQQLEYLRRHFVPMSLPDLVARRVSGEPLPARAVAVTIDDGYLDFAEHAYPQLQRFGIPVTLYTVSRFAAGSQWLWFDRLRYVCEHTRLATLSVSLPEGPLSRPMTSADERERAWDVIATRCLTLPTAAREQLIESCASAAEVDIPARPTGNFAALDFAGLRALDPALVDIGGHTLTHPILSMCTDAEVVEEVGGCRVELQAALGRAVHSFCYPNGRPCDFDARAIAAVRAAGFQSATASTGMLLGPDAETWSLPRFGAAHDLRTFRHEMDGLTYLQSRVPGGLAAMGAGEIAGRTASYAVL